MFASKLRRDRIRRYRIGVLRDAIARSFPEYAKSQFEFPKIFGELTDAKRRRLIWIVLYVMNGSLPTRHELEDAEASVHISGANEWLNEQLSKEISNPLVTFEIIENKILVDVFHTANAGFLTGIQRVVRETVSRWSKLHELTLVAWDDSWQYLRPLKQRESSMFDVHIDTRNGSESTTAIIPVNCHYVMVELIADPPRTSRLAAMFETGTASLDAIVYDCVPISSSETTADGMPYAFSNYLELLTRAHRLVPISDAAAIEYRGWKQMIASIGIKGPEICPVDLAAEVVHPKRLDLEEWQIENGFNSEIPLVTCIGSNEPRKNQLAVLRCAEQLWQSGYKFELLFIGGNSWNDSGFTTRIRELQAQGFPLRRLSKLSDEELYCAIAGSTFTIFPSLNEGFGLPVAESLLLGVPVITSRYGSTARISSGNGGLLVEPRDDHQIYEAIRRLLTDPTELQSLRDEASQFQWKTWDEYAEETWETIHTQLESRASLAV